MNLTLAAPSSVLLACAVGEDFGAARIEWPPVIALAVRERMVRRLERWFLDRGIPPHPALVEAATHAHTRVRDVSDLVARISAHLDGRGIPHLFLKLAQSDPDVGRDLDLLVAAGSSSSIPLPANGVPLDVHRGRLGRAGEHTRFARLVLQRRERHETGFGVVAVPTSEDQLLLLVLSRMYGRPAIRLSDVAFTARALHSESIDFDRLLALGAEAGLLDGLGCFLEYADQVTRELLNVPLIGASLRARLPGGPWGHVAQRRGSFHGSVSRVTPYLYLRLIAGRLLSGDFGAVGRVALLPIAVASDRRARRPQEPPPGSRDA